MKQIIHRKDGITYERKAKDKNFDARVTIKVNQEDVDALKIIAEYLGDNYTQMCREQLYKLIKKYDYLTKKQ